MSTKKLSSNQNNLIKRYLIWCFKTTKESLDRIDRYYTQYLADQFMLRDLKRQGRSIAPNSREPFQKHVAEFKEYLEKKKNKADEQRFEKIGHQQERPDYIYLTARLSAIEKAIKHFLGAKALMKIREAYEREMIGRILSAREHT